MTPPDIMRPKKYILLYSMAYQQSVLVSSVLTVDVSKKDTLIALIANQHINTAYIVYDFKKRKICHISRKIDPINRNAVVSTNSNYPLDFHRSQLCTDLILCSDKRFY